VVGRLLQSLAVLGLVLPAACRSLPKPAEYQTEGFTFRTEGDWEDLDAAVLAGAWLSEFAIIDRGDSHASPRTFELVATNDEPATLTAWQEGDDVVLRAHVGWFGDRNRERYLAKAVGGRLCELRGRDAAPLRGYP
jgi:hypothetical protein